MKKLKEILYDFTSLWLILIFDIVVVWILYDTVNFWTGLGFGAGVGLCFASGVYRRGNRQTKEMLCELSEKFKEIPTGVALIHNDTENGMLAITPLPAEFKETS